MILIIIHYVPLSFTTLMMIVIVVCTLGMVLNLEDRFRSTIFTTVMSVMTALMYITPPEAIVYKILWVVVGAIVVSLINFGFLPYSVEKESRNNLKWGFKSNSESIELLKDMCKNRDISRKNSLLVATNVVRENIEVTDENRNVFELQSQIADICNFILSYSAVEDYSDNLKNNMLDIIENDGDVNEDLSIKEKIRAYSVKNVNTLFINENKYFNNGGF